MSRMISLRRRKATHAKLNLVPFTDIILVMVFFILMSATFYHINDIATDVAVVSVEEKSDLILKLSSQELVLSSGNSVLHRFQRQARTGEFSYDEVRKVIAENNDNASSITFEPENELTFEEISKIMVIVQDEFKKIIFGNLL